MASSFRLNRVLRLRTQLRLLRGYEAGALQRQVGTLEREVGTVCEAQERVAEGERHAAEARILTPETLQLGRAYAAALADSEHAYRVAMIDAGRALVAKRAEVVTSHQEESKVRRLEEVHRERTDAERLRLVALGLDELAIDRHERARRQR